MYDIIMHAYIDVNEPFRFFWAELVKKVRSTLLPSGLCFENAPKEICSELFILN